jgi:hypothetical protein
MCRTAKLAVKISAISLGISVSLSEKLRSDFTETEYFLPPDDDAIEAFYILFYKRR